MPGYCDVGSVDRAALAGLVAGLAWLDSPERSDRLSLARGRANRVREFLSERPGVTCRGFSPATSRMPVVAFTVADRSPGDLVSALAERGVIASGGLQCAPLAHETLGTSPHGVLRVSFGPGNGEVDVEAAIAALEEILG